MTSAVGRSLELYYINGRPDGMLNAELFNWTGQVLMAPRTQIVTALARPEASYAGVYLLLGEANGERLAYIGEGEDIAARIPAHDANKDWWTNAVLVTASANRLNKAHVRYLEAALIALARSIGRMPLENGTNPQRPSLTEADIAKMEAFLENLFIVLPALRVDMFIQRARPGSGPGVAPPTAGGCNPPFINPVPSAQFVLDAQRHGLRAQANLTDGEFIVEAGSMARKEWSGVGSQATSYAQLHKVLRRSGVLVVDGDHCRFAENYVFRSTSAGAAVVLGRPASGPLEWKQLGTGITYREWEAQQLSSAQPAPE